MRRQLSIAFLVFAAASPSRAASAGDDQLPGTVFYAVRDAVNPAPVSAAFESAFGPLAVRLNLPESAVLSALNWTLFDRAAPAPNQKYVRLAHFGTWLDPASEPGCLNTRALVLRRDSRVPVMMEPNNACIVSKGVWQDPYSNRKFTDSRQVQIDHVVPLKNAYISGAFRWDWRTRCAYANFRGNPFHLRVVDGPINMQKGDMGPQGFLPPFLPFRCEYLADWLRIKLIWGLWISAPEANAINTAVRALNCDPRAFQISVRDLNVQRQAILASRNDCPNAPPPASPQALNDPNLEPL